MAFDHYPVEKRKKIALWCVIGVAIVLIAVLIFLYVRPQDNQKNDFGTLIAHGYTTIVERVLVLFDNK